VYVSLSATVFVASASPGIFHDFARPSPCAPRCLCATHFFLVRTLCALPMLPSANFSTRNPATVLSLGSAGHTLFVSGYVCSLCSPLVHALDTTRRLTSTSLLDRNLVIVISLECARHIYSLTMHLASGCAPNFARCLSLSAPSIILSLFPLSFANVPSLSRSYNTDDPPSLPHWTVCLSFLQQILVHENFSRVCTTFLLRHCHVSTDRLRLLRQSSRGRKRLHTLNLEVNPPPPIYRD